MQMFWSFVAVVQVLSALVMIGLVLVQHGKGADMGASFGSGASGSLFGATGSANFLSRSTAACASIFFASTLALSGFAHRPGASQQGDSVLERAATTQAPASAPAAAASAVVLPPSAPEAAASGAAAIPTK